MTGCRMTEATNRPMRQTSPMNWLAGQDFDFAEFAAFLRRHDPEWLIQCASRTAHTPALSTETIVSLVTRRTSPDRSDV